MMVDRSTHAPELLDELDWFSTSNATDLSSEEGKIIILYFWTHSSFDSVFSLSQFDDLNKLYPNHLSVIGIHTPKYDYEKDFLTAQEVEEKYNFSHPMAQDSEVKQARRYGVEAYPSVFFINTEGDIVANVAGEFDFNDIQRAVEAVMEKESFESDPVQSQSNEESRGSVFFPEDIAISGNSKRIAVTNFSGHEVWIYDREGQRLEIIGEGIRGNQMGQFDQARFDNPMGLDFDGMDLLIADAGNHSVKRVDFLEEEVTEEISANCEDPSASLRYPARILAGTDYLWISSTATHSIFRWEPIEGTLEQAIGSGKKGNYDGVHSGAELAHPMGLYQNGDEIFFVDSMTNSIRSFHRKKYTVHTFIEGGLYDFGDRVGSADEALLQYPVDITGQDENLLVVDSYNSKLKRFNVEEEEIKNWLGNGTPNSDQGERTGFSGPRGIDQNGNLILIADSWNKRILEIEAETGRSKVFTDQT